MPLIHTRAALFTGCLLLASGLSSCTLLPSSSRGGSDTPRTLGARMEKHTEVLQKDIGARNARKPKSMEAAAKYIAGNFSDMGYAVTLQPVAGGNAKKGTAIYNVLVYKPGLYSNNQSIVVGANYDSNEQLNNGSGAALLLETARGLRDIPTNHNIYFVAYANGAAPAGRSSSSGAYVHARALSGSIGAANILGMINLEPQELGAAEGQKQPEPESPQEAVLFMTTPRGKEFAGQCAAPFTKSWEQAPPTFHREPSAIAGNDRHYAALNIPTVSCQCKYAITDSHTEDYVHALTDMIHQIADNDVPKPEKTAAPEPKKS
ncbi:hypothetical protein [Akkermansia sp.]|uniref:hypothetical protein n=1 Tax=Akkermansia sp. TaxID=1872421 RepID=UPI0025C0B995|nr:hypothetical protein [Akkermansia sp.]MCC8149327.1 hypothetical protein [Akkermansia sp.]